MTAIATHPVAFAYRWTGDPRDRPGHLDWEARGWWWVIRLEWSGDMVTAHVPDALRALRAELARERLASVEWAGISWEWVSRLDWPRDDVGAEVLRWRLDAIADGRVAEGGLFLLEDPETRASLHGTVLHAEPSGAMGDCLGTDFDFAGFRAEIAATFGHSCRKGFCVPADRVEQAAVIFDRWLEAARAAHDARQPRRRRLSV